MDWVRALRAVPATDGGVRYDEGTKRGAGRVVGDGVDDMFRLDEDRDGFT